MNLTQFKEKIFDWIFFESSLDSQNIFWQFQKAPKPFSDFITLNLIDLNQKASSSNFKNNDGIIEIKTLLDTTLSINFYGLSAEILSLKVWQSLQKDSTREKLSDVGYQKPSEVRNLSYIDEDMQNPVNRYQFDVKMNFILSDTDDVGYFDKIIIKGYLEEQQPENLFFQKTLPED